MTPQEWQASGTYVNTILGPVFVRQTEGDGPVLLLIHGFPTASWDWHRVWPLLEQQQDESEGRSGASRQYGIVAIDMLGFGFSAKPLPHRYSIIEQAQLHLHVLAALEITECHILAHDYGDTVVQELLARQVEGELPFKIHSVAFLNGGLFPGVHRPEPIQRLLMSPLGPMLTPFLGRSNLARTFRRIFGAETQPTEVDIDHFWELIVYNDGKPVIPRLIKYMRERKTYEDRWVGALHKTNIPLLLIDGADDPISGAHLAAHFRQVLPQAQVVELPGIGHYPQLEAPEQVARAYREFRQSLATR